MPYRTKPGWVLPEVIDNGQRKCIQINIPDDFFHRIAFWGALEQLGWYNAWERDDAKRGKDAAALWRGIIKEAFESEGCTPMATFAFEQDECTVTLLVNGESAASFMLDGTLCPNLKGEKGDPGDQGDQGLPGAPGAPGAPGGVSNIPELPPTGTPEMCNAVDYIAEQLEDLILQTLTDAATLTITEILESLIIAPGWDGSFLQQFIEFIFLNILETDLDTRVSAYIDAVTQHLYCADLDISSFKIAMEADTSLTDTVARDAWIAAAQATDAGLLALWAFVGSTKTGADCSTYECGDYRACWLGYCTSDVGWATENCFLIGNAVVINQSAPSSMRLAVQDALVITEVRVNYVRTSNVDFVHYASDGETELHRTSVASPLGSNRYSSGALGAWEIAVNDIIRFEYDPADQTESNPQMYSFELFGNIYLADQTQEPECLF